MQRASPTTVLALRSASAEYGCHEKVADAWLRKEQEMYSDRTGIGLPTGVHHFNLVSDPGQHNYRECLVSVNWCWEISQGMHCPWQHLAPGKVLTPLDVPNVDPELCRLCCQTKTGACCILSGSPMIIKSIAGHVFIFDSACDLAKFQIARRFPC